MGNFWSRYWKLCGYAGGRNDCAKCHSGAGFVEWTEYQVDTTLAYPEHPGTNIGCQNCHSGHQTFDPQDDALRWTESSISIADSIAMDLGGPSNTCIVCHQPRRNWESYLISTDSANVNSSHAGPHHGPQGAVLQGFGGTLTGSTHAHTSAGCVTCHIGEYNATEETGSHTFKPNNENCTQCHTVGTDFDYNGYVTDFDTDFATLESKLQTAGIIDVDGATVTGIYSTAVYKAWWDYELLKEDRSHGVHNPSYASTLLSNAIAALP